MGFRATTIIFGISTLLFMVSNVAYVVVRIGAGWGFPWDLGLLGWAVSFIFQMPSLLVSTIFNRKRVALFLSAFFFVLGQLIYVILLQIQNKDSIGPFMKSLINWPYLYFSEEWGGVYSTANILLFIGTLLYFVAFFLALGNKDNTLPNPQDFNFTQNQVLTLGYKTSTINEKRTIDDPYLQIEKLGELMAKGFLTQEEFDAKKREILGS